MPVNDRLARAKQMRNRKGGGSSGPSSSLEEVKRIEVSGVGTVAAICLLLGLGASLTSSYIMIHNPGCMGTTAVPIVESNAVPVVESKTPASPAAGNLRTPSWSAISAPQRPGFPPSCTVEQLRRVEKQLSNDKCYEPAYTQACSLTQATARSPCADNRWVREVYGQLKVDQFTAIFTGNACGRHEFLMEAMAIGSHDPAKFDSNKWTGTPQAANCRQAIPTLPPPQPALGVCISEKPDVISGVLMAKTAMGLTNEIKDVKANLGVLDSSVTSTLDKVVQEVGLKDKPIHYLHVRGEDYNVLRGALDTLDQVRYLEFEVHYAGTWASGDLRSLVKRQLAEKNFVCYWNGGSNGLWRITDCWLAHFDEKWWSYVACASTVHEESKEILAKMEAIFAETLKKEKTF
jgi:hypothetical protein